MYRKEGMIVRNDKKEISSIVFLLNERLRWEKWWLSWDLKTIMGNFVRSYKTDLTEGREGSLEKRRWAWFTEYWTLVIKWHQMEISQGYLKKSQSRFGGEIRKVLASNVLCIWSETSYKGRFTSPLVRGRTHEWSSH